MKFDIVLIERPVALAVEEMQTILSYFDGNVLPIDLASTQVESCAMGLISEEAAEQLNYEFTQLNQFVDSILSDMNLESADNTYQYYENGQPFQLLLTRNLAPNPNPTKSLFVELRLTDLANYWVNFRVPQNITDQQIKQVLHATHQYLYDIKAYPNQDFDLAILLKEIQEKTKWTCIPCEPDVVWSDNDHIQFSYQEV